MKDFLFEFSRKFYIFIGIGFAAYLLFSSAACSITNSAQTNNQNSNIPAIVKVERSTPNLNGRAYKSKTLLLNRETLKNLNCNNQSAYNLVEAENYLEEEYITARDLNVVVGNEVIVKIELPTGFEAKNFSLNSTNKTQSGFQMNTEWGGGNFHYEIQFDFRCKENNFYLYKVRKDSFSTSKPGSRNYWDVKETKVTKIEPNLPIEKFVITELLQ